MARDLSQFVVALILVAIVILCFSGLSGCGKDPSTVQGARGADGATGTNGHSAVVTLVNSALSCSNGGRTILTATDANDNNVLDGGDTNLQSAEICHGNNAPATPFTPSEMIDPCGDTPGIYDEVLLKLANNSILASFSDNANGQNTRLSIVVPGNYVTSDGSNCHFTVNANGSVTW